MRKPAKTQKFSLCFEIKTESLVNADIRTCSKKGANDENDLNKI